jgi:hypothetical protein
MIVGADTARRHISAETHLIGLVVITAVASLSVAAVSRHKRIACQYTFIGFFPLTGIRATSSPVGTEALNLSRNAYMPADRRQTGSLRQVFHILTIKLTEIQEGRSNYLLHRRWWTPISDK